MAVQVLFVQGAGANVHDEWDRKLVESLERGLGPGYLVRYPRMPGEEDPQYASWKPALIHELDSLHDGAVLIGHSAGATVLLHVLAEHRLSFKPGGLFLIAAPFIGDGGWPSNDIQPLSDFAKRLSTGLPVFLYHGSEDEAVPTSHVQLYAHAMPQAVVRILDHRDHQLNGDLSEIAREIHSLSTL